MVTALGICCLKGSEALPRSLLPGSDPLGTQDLISEAREVGQKRGLCAFKQGGACFVP